jgi:hypothetical protein
MSSLENLSVPHPRGCPFPRDIQSCKTIIKELDQKIQNGVKKKTRSRNGFEELQQKRANYLSFISPFRCLQAEVLRTIVYSALHNGVDILALTHICGRLRDIVIKIAPLWSHLNLPSTQSFGFFFGPRQEDALEVGSIYNRGTS